MNFNFTLTDLVFHNNQISVCLNGEVPDNFIDFSFLFVFSYLSVNGELINITAKRELSEKPYRFKLNYPRLDLPLVDFCIFFETGSSRFEVPQSEDVVLFIQSLFPKSEIHFDEVFSSRSSRAKNIYNQFFFCRQVEDFYKGAPHQIIGATITKCYKAAESGNDIYLKEALRNIDKSFSLLEKCVNDWRPRVNSQHLRVSLLCALMHVYISQQDTAGFLRVVSHAEIIFNNTDFITNYFTASFPLSKIFLASFFFNKIREDYTASLKYSNFLHENFLNCANDSEKSKTKIILYEDISRVFMSSVYSLQYLDKKFDESNPDHLEAVAYSFRLGGKSKNRIVDDFIKLARKN